MRGFLEVVWVVVGTKGLLDVECVVEVVGTSGFLINGQSNC